MIVNLYFKTLLVIICVVPGFLVLNCLADFFGYNIVRIIKHKKKAEVSIKQSLMWMIVYLAFCAVVVTTSIFNMGWIHLLYSPLLLVHTLLVGFFLSPYTGVNIPTKTKILALIINICFYLTLGDGADTGGFYFFYGMIRPSEGMDPFITPIFILISNAFGLAGLAIIIKGFMDRAKNSSAK